MIDTVRIKNVLQDTSNVIDVNGSGQLTIPKIILSGTRPIEFTDTTWDDLRFPATTSQQGNTAKPDYDYTDLGLLFPQNDPTEIAHYIVQFPHSWKIGSSIKPHVHFIQSANTVPVFKMDYRWYDNGDAVPTSWTTISTTGLVYTYESGSMAQIAIFPEISGSGIDGVSSIMDIKLYRDDNVVTGDVLVKEFDIHYQINTIGSGDEYGKS